jgi:hypothetical protein
MKIKEKDIIYIKNAFGEMDSKGDFLLLLNYTKVLLYGSKTTPFELKNINYHSNPNSNKKRYSQFSIKKKSGGERIINSPTYGLKTIQKCLNLIFQTIYDVNPVATGFVPEKSIVDNAKKHLDSYYIYNIDLKDFFPSIDAGRVWGRLKYAPFNLAETKGRIELLNVITWLCSDEMEVERLDENKVWQKVKRNVLPQGAPTSPTLSNIICQQLDFYMSAVAKRFGLRYSRYADDMTFSSLHNVYQKDGDFFKEIHRIVSEQGFFIKENKTRLQKQGFRQEVTGLIVNEKVNVQKRYIKELRMWLYYWETYGYVKANKYFSKKYISDKGYTKKGMPSMNNVISGKLEYLKMVKGKENELYKKLASRFNLLTKKSTESAESIEVKKIDKALFGVDSNLSGLIINIEKQGNSFFDDRINNDIKIPKGTKVPFTFFVENKVKAIKKREIWSHNPIYNVNFLKQFKYEDGSGFKELLHDVNLDKKSIYEILNLVKNNENFINYFSGIKVANINFLNKGIYFEVMKLIESFELEGVPFYEKTGKHPIQNNFNYTEFALDFDKKLSYGSNKGSYNMFDDILKIAKKLKLYQKINFFPDERAFNIRTSFITWQPSVYKGLEGVFQILKDYEFDDFDSVSRKEILIDAKMEGGNQKYTQIEILYKGESCPDSYGMLDFFKKSEIYKSYFLNLCDWVVEYDFLDELSKRYNLLVSDSVINELPEIEILNEKVGGIKHIIKFYDV